MLINWLVCNSLLIIGLIPLFVNSAALQHRHKCSCPSRNEIYLNAEHDKSVILSPNFPRPYCAKLNCEWRIRTPSNNSLVRFHASKIDTRPNRDFIFFYDATDEEPSHNCTGRTKNCEYLSSGSLLIVRFSTARGVNDKYGFQATLTLFDSEDDIQNLSDEDEAHASHKKSSAWNLFVWVLLACVIIFIVAAVLFWFCKKQQATEDNRSPLLDKSSNNKREDSIHLSLNSPNDNDELNE